MAVGHGIQAVSKVDGGDGDSILAIVDASTIGEYVDVGTLGAKFAVTLSNASGRASVTCRTRWYKEGLVCEGGPVGGWEGGVVKTEDVCGTFAKYLQTFSAAAPMS